MAIAEFILVINVNSCSMTHRFRIMIDLSDNNRLPIYDKCKLYLYRASLTSYTRFCRLFSLNLNWRNADFSASWRHKSNIMAYSERQLQTSYLWLISTFALSLTVSKLNAILAFFLLLKRKWRTADFSARWCQTSHIMADSETQLSTSYSWLMPTFALSGIVSNEVKSDFSCFFLHRTESD